MQFESATFGDIGHIPLMSFREARAAPFRWPVRLLDRNQDRLAKNCAAAPNCTVPTINLADYMWQQVVTLSAKLLARAALIGRQSTIIESSNVKKRRHG